MINKEVTYSLFKDYLYSQGKMSWNQVSNEHRKYLSYFYYKDHVKDYDVFDLVTEKSYPESEEFRNCVVDVLFDDNSKSSESMLKRAVIELYIDYVSDDFDESASEYMKDCRDHAGKRENLIINL